MCFLYLSLTEFLHPTPGTLSYLCYAMDMHEIIGSSPRAFQWGNETHGTLVSYGWKPQQPNSPGSHTANLYISPTAGLRGWNDNPPPYETDFECAVMCEKQL